MRKYKAVCVPKADVKPDEDQVGLTRMELTFTVGVRSKQTPQQVVDHTLRDMGISRLMDVTFHQVTDETLATNSGPAVPKWHWILTDETVYVNPLWEEQMEVRRLHDMPELVLLENYDGRIYIGGNPVDVGDDPRISELFAEAEENELHPFISAKELPDDYFQSQNG